MPTEREIFLSEVEAFILNSSRGGCLAKINDVSRFQLRIAFNGGGKHPTKNRLVTTDELYTVHVGIRKAVLNEYLNVDARGNAPQQLADGLRRLAVRLNEMADEVQAVPCEPYQHKPKVYVTRDKITGDSLGSALNMKLAAERGKGYEDMTNETTVIHGEPIEDHPQWMEQFQKFIGGLPGDMIT